MKLLYAQFRHFTSTICVACRLKVTSAAKVSDFPSYAATVSPPVSPPGSPQYSVSSLSSCGLCFMLYPWPPPLLLLFYFILFIYYFRVFMRARVYLLFVIDIVCASLI